MGEIRHFLDIDRLSAATLRHLLRGGAALKRALRASQKSAPLAGRHVALVFDKPSTRTRVSFQVGVQQLGAGAVVLDSTTSQRGRGETPGDTARVLARYADAIVLRTGDPAILLEMADAAGVPVINGLTDTSHPCQIMADILTFEEKRGPITGRVIAWSGDGNNVARSWVHAAARLDFALRIATPPSRRVPAEVIAWAEGEGADLRQFDAPAEAVAGADCLVTDVWQSMGDESGAAPAQVMAANMAPYRVDEALMARARDNALFMHCLPAHRGDEVTAGVIDGPHSVVWDEAENRLHAQKAILLWCLRRDIWPDAGAEDG